MIMMMSILLYELKHDPFKYDMIKQYILSVMSNNKNYTSLSCIRKPAFYLLSSLENKNVPVKYLYQFDINTTTQQFYSFQLELYLVDYYQLYAEIIKLWVSQWRLKYEIKDKINQYIVQMKWYHPKDLNYTIIYGFLQPLLNDHIYINDIDIDIYYVLRNNLTRSKKYDSIYLHHCYGSIENHLDSI
jgi:hypothetical protein